MITNILAYSKWRFFDKRSGRLRALAAGNNKFRHIPDFCVQFFQTANPATTIAKAYWSLRSWRTTPKGLNCLKRPCKPEANSIELMQVSQAGMNIIGPFTIYANSFNQKAIFTCAVYCCGSIAPVGSYQYFDLPQFRPRKKHGPAFSLSPGHDRAPFH
jgi:hypothetical protein